MKARDKIMKYMNHMKRAQSVIEYIIILTVIVGGVIYFATTPTSLVSAVDNSLERLTEDVNTVAHYDYSGDEVDLEGEQDAWDAENPVGGN